MRSNAVFPVPAPDLFDCAQARGRLEQEPRDLIKPLVYGHIRRNYDLIKSEPLVFAC